ncbi:LOW QUALITY PROTEIN: TRAP-type uncharacterized transport system, fused permease component [Geomicrobium sp. JCM 19055]|nr:LOW QUALITY PROTEIN: TRAP-type uncharacterized transport system, fused permease component [Geomicrobium sp. JCM 19055]
MLGNKQRTLVGVTGKVVSFLAILMSLFHLYTAFFGVFESIAQRSIHLAFALVLVFALYRPTKNQEGKRIPWYDIVAILLVLGSFQYFALNAIDISARLTYVTPLSTLEIVIGVIASILLIEATRRVVGRAFTIIVLAFLGYGFFGQYLPGGLEHRGFDLMWILDHLFYSTMGVFSTPLGVSATFIFLFILFGKFLEVSGAGNFFINLSVGLMGKYRGGPAKTAVAGSAILGTISGSAVANTATTGPFTIPLMKRTGYKGTFAAAVEAVSSAGGQIIPPIMGAAAFIIASYLGVPYIEVAIAAIIPAILYYVCVYFQVDLRAKKRRPRWYAKRNDSKGNRTRRWNVLLPLLIIVIMLVMGYSPMRAALFAIASVIVVAAFKAATRLSFGTMFKALDLGARAALETAIACASAGFIIGVISMTGIGLQFSSMILAISGDSLFITLLLTMVASLLLGLGLPTVAAYIVQVPLTIPALVQLGVEPMAAHLFVFYFAILSAITPPVALASFAASGIANTNPLQTSLVALRLGIAGFIVPFMFVYGPSLIWIGTPGEVVITLTTALVGVFALSAAIEGWWLRGTYWYERIALFVAAIMLVVPDFLVSLAGFAIFAIVFVLQKWVMPKKNHSEHQYNEAL